MCDKKEYTPEMSSYMETELQMSTQAGRDKFKKRNIKTTRQSYSRKRRPRKLHLHTPGPRENE